MEKEKILQIAIPAVAIAAIVLVVALIASSSSTETIATKTGSGIAPPVAPGKKMIAEVANKPDGVSLTKPDLNAAEWKDVGAGLKVWETEPGEGTEQILVTDEGLWHYSGWLVNGRVFDSSLRKGEPITFGLQQVIRGWTQGLAGMKVGGVRRLFIPAALGYGGQDKGEIPPNSDLVFEVKLLRISR